MATFAPTTLSLLTRSSSKRVQSALATQYRSYSAPVDTIPASKQRFIPDRESSHVPKGFVLGSAHAGVKASNKTKDDVCIIASEQLCSAAGYFTTNAFRAAPVSVSIGSLRANSDGMRGVVINSGCANAVTGTDGFDHAHAMASRVDELFSDTTQGESPIKQRKDGDANGRETHQTLVMSTGVIGQKLPIDKILGVLPQIKDSLSTGYDAWLSTAKAIMTTDTFPKLVTRQFTLPSHPDTTYTIAGISKGAGMIHPNLATLLSVICTDVKISSRNLRWVGSPAMTTSFNSISIDGDTSTNDSVVILANGAAAPENAAAITMDDVEDWEALRSVIQSVTTDLAKLVVRDGEGATKFITIRVSGAETPQQATKVAETIARSPLVKTAMYGRDANWGRILCAVGNAGVHVLRNRVTVSFGLGNPTKRESGHVVEDKMTLVNRGQPQEVDEELAKEVLEKEDISIYVRLDDRPGDMGNKGGATYWTCDFSHEYVTINGDYRT
ncbi:arginine biosynthesis ArgJ, mitochondrial [Elsinoe ampelina]|uniref:Arginine biosynthesis bifunctional protein ArgJ, mitochondrial n=1 Tax=Elsinoe ampelina TaxID=302913 RepID=A0A6A6G1W7_9PEZI|nr:arginine biosynthesis ArgJ, mitochondrial [Elsinoe ampelina]